MGLFYFYTDMDLKSYRTIIECFRDFYPEDRIDLHISNSILKRVVESGFQDNPNDLELQSLDASDNAMYVRIHYPSITITNEHGKQHTILDVYVQHTFPKFVMTLGRTTYTQDEINVGYIHSHVRRGGFCSLNDFCLGNSNTPINLIRQKIASKNYNDFNTLVTSYIIESERTLRTESIAGVPYVEMRAIVVGSREYMPISIEPKNNTLVSHALIKRVKDLISFYIRQGLDEFYYDGSSWQLKATDAEFIKRVTKVAKLYKMTANYPRMYFPVVYKSGLYYKQGGSTGYSLDRTRTDYTFKGKLLDVKIVRRDKDDFERTEIVNPTILNVVYWFLINFINGVYASDKYKDCLHSRAVKIKNCLLRAIGD